KPLLAAPALPLGSIAVGDVVTDADRAARPPELVADGSPDRFDGSAAYAYDVRDVLPAERAFEVQQETRGVGVLATIELARILAHDVRCVPKGPQGAALAECESSRSIGRVQK